MRLYHLSAPLILLAWQEAPLPHAATGEDGKLHWSLSAMAGPGAWEDAQFNCAGDLVSAQSVGYRDVGAKGELLEPRSGLHLSVAGGTTRRDDRPGSNTFGGAQVAMEWPDGGFGGGLVSRAGGGATPNVYVRIGSASHNHFRAEVMPLTETRTMAGDFRVGVGSPHGFVGLTFGPYYRALLETAVFADFALPVSDAVDARVAANAGPGERQFQWGLAAGLRVHR